MADDGWDSGDDHPVTAAPVFKSVTYSRSGRGGPGRGGSNREGHWNNENRNDASKGFRGGKHEERGGYRGRGRGNQYQGSSTSMSINSSDVGKVIGRGGCRIRDLQTDSGAEITVEKNNNFSDKTEIILRGSPESQAKAKLLIEELTNDEGKGGGGSYRRRPYEDNKSENNQQSYYTPPVDKELEKIEPPLIDWDALNRDYEEAQRIRWSKCPKLIKMFYIEDPAIENMHPNSVANFRKEKRNIVVNYTFGECNEHIPNPVMTFEQAFSPYPDILELIYGQKFTEPSPIQCQAWPILLSGKDLIGIAQTGTGKTLAFLLPAFIHIEGQPVPRGERGGPNVLILAPTRELAQQIQNEANKYSYRGIKSICIYGGGDRREQINGLKRGVEIVVATPGRMNDLIAAGVLNLSAVTYLVLDEADRMLDMGFEPDIRKTLLDIRPDRQTVMTSATWPPGVRRLAQSYMSNPIQVYVGSLDLAATHTVTQEVEIMDDEDKEHRLMEFLLNMAPEDKVMVFVGKKILADHIASELALKLIHCDVIHGDRDQVDRESALNDLKSGEIRILIATDVASRGIDIQDITHIINYDLPRNIEEYVHRCGRTGRAGRTGTAISFVTRHDWGMARELITMLEEANQIVPEELYQMADRFEAKKEKRDQERRDGKSFGGRGGGRGRRW